MLREARDNEDYVDDNVISPIPAPASPSIALFFHGILGELERALDLSMRRPAEGEHSSVLTRRRRRRRNGESTTDSSTSDDVVSIDFEEISRQP